MLLAVDVAILLPPEIAGLAIAVSAGLPADESQGLRLDDTHLPHLTLAQAFVDQRDMDRTIEEIGRLLEGRAGLTMRSRGAARSSSSVSLEIERSRPLEALHADVMAVLKNVERPDGDAKAFFAADARERDVKWVAGFRTQSSFDRFWPHVTLGHAEQPPQTPATVFTATDVAVCHLGRFCSCRQALHRWTLS